MPVTMHPVRTVSGAVAMAPTITTQRDHAVRPQWGEVPAHMAGVYSDHRDPAVQEMAFAWRMSPATVKVAYLAMRMQSGAHLCQAADAHAKSLGYRNTPDARRSR